MHWIFNKGGSIKQVLHSTAGETGHSTRTGEDGSSGTGKTGHSTRTGEDGGSGTGKIGHFTRTKRKHKTATPKRQHGELRVSVSVESIG